MKEKSVKICLMTSNIICLFLGIATFSGGLVLQFNTTVQNVLKAASDSISSTSIGILSVIMLAVGGLIILVSFVGCCGVMSDSKCMIGLYCAFLILLLLGQLAVGALGLFYGLQKIDSSFREHFVSMLQSNSKFDGNVLDSVQETFECCGYDGPGDYLPGTQQSTANPINVTGADDVTLSTSTIPLDNTTPTSEGITANTTSEERLEEDKSLRDSCCKKNESTYVDLKRCKDNTLSIQDREKYLYLKGCKESVVGFIEKNAVIIGGVSLGFALLEIISIVAGCILYKSLD